MNTRTVADGKETFAIPISVVLGASENRDYDVTPVNLSGFLVF
jgi:hypothetical protein